MTDGSRHIHHGDVVSIGETMLYFQAEDYGLLRYAQRFEKFIGGTESNTLISLAKLGFSLVSAYRCCLI